VRVALALQVNDINYQTEIAFATEISSVKLASFGIHVKSNIQDYGGFATYMGPTTGELELRFFIDQLDNRPNGLILGELEKKLQTFCTVINAHFQSRNVIFERDIKVVDYKLLLGNYDLFGHAMYQLSRKRSDAEFTKALESKLSED
jgi:hypothetical protein